MPNAFGIDDDRYEIAKGLPSALRGMLNAKGRDMEGTKAYGALESAANKAKSWKKLPGQLSASSKTGTKNPEGSYQASRLIAADRGHLAATKIAEGGSGAKDIKRGKKMRDASRSFVTKAEVSKGTTATGLKMVSNPKMGRTVMTGGGKKGKAYGPDILSRIKNAKKVDNTSAEA